MYTSFLLLVVVRAVLGSWLKKQTTTFLSDVAKAASQETQLRKMSQRKSTHQKTKSRPRNAAKQRARKYYSERRAKENQHPRNKVPAPAMLQSSEQNTSPKTLRYSLSEEYPPSP